MAAITICIDFGAQKNKVCHCFHCFPIYLPWSDGTRCHDLSFLNSKFIVNCVIHPLQSQVDFPDSSVGKELSCNVGDLGSIPGLGRFPGEGNGYPLRYSGLENSMDSIAHGVTKSWTQLSGFHFHFQSQALHFEASNAKSYLTLRILVAPCGILHASLQQKAWDGLISAAYIQMLHLLVRL